MPEGAFSSIGARLPQRPRTPVLFVHHRSELGGAPASLSYLIRELDHERFEAHIYCPPGPAAELFRESGAHVHTGAVSGFTHIWASTYRGRRWLLFARELALLPQHVVQFRRALRRGRFELVHFNDSPLIPAAWLARHEGLPVVWHLRSALPDGGRDRRSHFVRTAIRRLATTSIAINHDVATVFGVGSTVVANSVDLARFRPGRRAGAKEALGLPERPPGRLLLRLHLPVEGLPRVHRGRRAAPRPRARRELPDRRRRRPRRRSSSARSIGRGLQLADLTRDYESEAKALVDELGLSEVVRFVPFTQDTANLYQASDVVVAPSQGPELGRPVIEAAASGVPVVASGSRTGGGVVVPGRDRRARRGLPRRHARRGGRGAAPPPGAPPRARAGGARARGAELRPGRQRAPDRGDLPPDRARARRASRSSTSTTARSSAARRRASRS